ncbi:cobaltochelatase subunit CobN [Pseudomaricurvus alkylphenolicus]|uniref:cobaltochelatase subunit CobN n=1 Tax=Pseudomaricurvus alkylphenolicus TaxID=1306991 RepID=UPI0014244324|nr:cobaltochelatase subunit CobN [Pseudomaricurvus alkylphenolicus]NIB38894.1 cobaltochelatase subunit CobN [Pseudomaricurvus alkylphenolicus]
MKHALLNRYALAAYLVLMVATTYWAYANYFGPTRVALVNYRDFQVAKFTAAKEAGWVKVESFDHKDLSQLHQYDVVLVFGRGLKLNDEELAQLKRVASSRTVIVDSAMNPAHAINSVPDVHQQAVQAYMDNAGAQNYLNLLRYFRKHIDAKLYDVLEPEAPVEIGNDVLFHLASEAIFENVRDFQQYYEALEGYDGSAPKIALITSVPGPFNSNRDHIDALIKRLEQENLRVYPIASNSRRLAFMREIEPDAVVMMPHGRLHVGDSKEAVRWLQERNIPLLSPLSVFEDHDQWLQNPQGYHGALLSMNVVLPELDGAIAPYVINAQFKDENGHSIFKPVEHRLDQFVSLLKSHLKLRHQDNADKKIAIVYFRGPGKNALVAGNMEVAPSLYNTLRTLESHGYDVGGLPSTFSEFKRQLDRQGTVMTPDAMGQSEEFLTEGNPAFLSSAQYKQHCTELADDLCQQVEALYGEAPGNFLVKPDKGIAVARLQFGNIAILPQPLPGLGDNTFKLVHGTDKAPPHTYLAAYFWLRHTFAADAVIHFGTHGSLEFTPKKQVALSERDWADAMLGGMPHFYIYTMSNVGEAIIAKRRSYATIINHLTPPFSEAGLKGDLKPLAEQLGNYYLAEGAVQARMREEINKQVLALGLHEDLQLGQAQLQDTNNWEITVAQPLAQWFETVAAEKITEGLYTLGKAYQSQQLDNTVELMFADTLKYQLADMAQLQRALGRDVNYEGFDTRAWIDRRLQGQSTRQLLETLFGSQRLADIERWKRENPSVSDMDIVRGFIALGAKSSAPKTASIENLDTRQLQQLTARVMADAKAREFIGGLQSDKAFSHVSKVLDPEAAAKAQVLAKVIPAIGRALEQLQNPDVLQLVTEMQDKSVRQQVFAWMDSADFEQQLRKAEAQHLEQLQDAAGGQIDSLRLGLSREAFAQLHWDQQKQLMETRQRFNERFLKDDHIRSSIAAALPESISVETVMNELTTATEPLRHHHQQVMTHYADLSRTLGSLRTQLDAIGDARGHLANAAEFEHASLLNALDGGYVSPATGGDPILNPLALPTGRNMYSIDAEKTPSAAAWKVGVELAEALLQNHLQTHGRYPKKVAFTLWPSSFIHSQGATIAQVLYLLGVEPVRDPFGRIQTLRLIPQEKLGRPRVDVVVQSAGQLRDLAASRLALIEEAVQLAATDPGGDSNENFVSQGVRKAEQFLLDKGLPPLQAKQLSMRRSFGGVNNAYGTGIMELVESGDRWEDQQAIARQYLNNMGAVYGDSGSWGEFSPHLFQAALLDTEAIVQPRSSNTWGALSLDHVYEFMGGLNTAVKAVTGNTPDAYFSDYRNSAKAKLTGLEETIWLEMRTTLLNPLFIEGLISEGGASSAEVFAETFRNTFGWNAMRPEAISTEAWNQLFDVYVVDKHQLQLDKFFGDKNPYALQEISGVMLEAARKGFWQADAEQLRAVATLHAQLVVEHDAGCGKFTCGNPKLREFISQQLQAALQSDFNTVLNRAEGSGDRSGAIVLEEQSRQTPTKQNADAISRPNTEPSEPQPDNLTNVGNNLDNNASPTLPSWSLAAALMLIMAAAFVVLQRRRYASA